MSSAHDSFASAWDDLHQRLTRNVPWGYDQPDEALDEFLSSLSPPLSRPLLDVGCGNGRNALHAVARGVRVVGVDASPVALAVAAGRMPGVRLECAELPPFPFADSEFGAAWDIGCLHALHPDRWHEYGRELGRVLCTGARVYIHARHRDPRVARTEPVFYVENVPEWALREDEVSTIFPDFDVVTTTPHEGRPPERFLRILMERRKC